MTVQKLKVEYTADMGGHLDELAQGGPKKIQRHHDADKLKAR
jgi:hypothetical protein